MRAYEAWSTAYFNWVVRHPVIVVALAAVAILACGFGIRNLSFDPDSRVFFGENNPQKLALDRMERMFTAANTVVFVVAAKQGSVLTKRGFATIEDLTARAWKTPHSSRVDSLANAQASRARDDEIVFEPYFKSAAGLTEAGAGPCGCAATDGRCRWRKPPSPRRCRTPAAGCWSSSTACA